MGGDQTKLRNGPMYRELTQDEINAIIARARQERAGAFGRWVAGMFGR